MKRKRYIFFDIDGTLITGGYDKSCVPASARLAIEKLKEAGHFLAIATGRGQIMAVDLMRDLGFHNMVSDGGYGITIDDQLLGITPLPKDKMVALVRECEEKGLPWGLQVDNTDTRLVPDSRFDRWTHDFYLKNRIVPGLDPEDYDTLYKLYIACPYPEEFTLTALKELPWCRYHPEYFFVEPTDKAFGIRKIMDHFHARYEDGIVFGDALNDLSMFTDDGWMRVAMGNAADEVKQKADYITTSVDCDGIWNACVALGLFDEKLTP